MLLQDTEQAVYSRKIGANKGKRRVWLEGKCLQDNGWFKGDAYTVMKKGTVAGFSGLLLVKAEHGEKRVSGRQDKPIIDLLGGIISNNINSDSVKVSVIINQFVIRIEGV